MSKTRATRLGVTVSLEMTIALDMLAQPKGLSLTTMATSLLRQSLDRTINSEACQIRIKQEQAFRTRDQWVSDQATDTFINNALGATEDATQDANHSH